MDDHHFSYITKLKKKTLVPIITQRWLFSQLSKVANYIIIIYFLVQRIQKVFLTV